MLYIIYDMLIYIILHINICYSVVYVVSSYLSIGCAGFSLLCTGFSLVAASRGHSSLRCFEGQGHCCSKVIAVASHCGAWALGHTDLSSCGTQALLLHSTWDLPGPGLKPMSPHWQANSQSLDHQGSPYTIILITTVS